MFKKVTVFFVISIFLVSVIGLGLVAESEEPKRGGTLVIADSMEPLTMDSMRTTFGHPIHQLISEPPIMYPPDATSLDDYTTSGWIESFEFSGDDRILTFHIKEGVKFHDGVPLDAEALAWKFRESIKNSEVWSTPLRFVENPDENVRVVDEYTIEIEQTRPNPNLIYTLASPSWLGAMVTPRAWERYENYGSKVAYGNGPFQFVEWKKGDQLTFVRNEDYSWPPEFIDNPGPPYLEKIIMKYVPEASTQFAMLKSNEVDALYRVPWVYAERIESLEDVELHSVESYHLFMSEYNTTKPPLDEEEVRKALNYAIDREALAEKVFYGYAEPAYTLYMSEALEVEGIEYMYELNLEKANSLLEQAGWKRGSDGFRTKDGKRLEFDLWTRNTTYFKQLAIALQGMWRGIGVDAKVRTFEEATLRQKVEAGEHEATVWRHQWPTLDMYYWLYNPENCPYPMQSCYESEELRSLVEKNLNSKTIEEFQTTNNDLLNYVYGKALRGALVRPLHLFAIRDVFENVVPRFAGWKEYLPYPHDVYRSDIEE